MNDLFSLNLFFQNAAGGGGYSGIHFQGESDWREVKCLANGCIASGAIQVRADKRIPRARILMTDNSSVEVPLVVVPK